MILFPNAKINLGLKVVGKRPDGFHDIETIFYPVGLCDVLEIVESKDGQFSFNTTGFPIAGDPQQNLSIRALKLLESIIGHRASGIENLPVKIHLHKIIPPGSGLGGGSSDGTHTIKLLNDLFSFGLTMEKMEEYAGTLGSDCPFFIRNKPVFASGKGDCFEPAEVSLSGYTLVIVVPDVQVNTTDAYRMIDEKSRQQQQNPYTDLKKIVSLPVTEWKNKLVNDFEKLVFKKFPELSDIKEGLYNAGAQYASMSGSGSAIYGIFPQRDPDLSAFKNYFIYSEQI